MIHKLRSIQAKGYVPDAILDIGAHVGKWTEDCLKIYPSADYFLFEANHYTELKRFAPVKNISVYDSVILNEKSEEITWYEMRTTGDSMFLEKTHYFTNPAITKRPSITLNDFITTNHILKEHNHLFIKIDCQGAEIPILKGASDILNRTDFIVLEIPFFGKYNTGVPTFLEHIQYMDSIGFVPYDIAEEHIICTFNVQIDIIFINKMHSFNQRVQDALLGLPVQKIPHITVLTYCTGYPYEVFQRFAGTLFDTGFSGNLVFVIQDCDKIHVTQLQKTYKKVSYYIDDVVNSRHCQQKRYYVFQKILPMLKTDYVLLSDSRDVLFQKNIELYPLDPTVDCYFFEEDFHIGMCNYNKDWLKPIEGELGIEIISRIKDKKIICSGTTYGSIKGIQKYLERMCDLMTHKIHTRNTPGFDQGIHNYLIYIEGFDTIKTKLLSNEDNLVNTLQYASHKGMNVHNQLVNIHNEPSYIAHQWDRLPKSMTDRLNPRYKFTNI